MSDPKVLPYWCDGCMYAAKYDCQKCRRALCRECSSTHKCSDLTVAQMTDLMIAGR